MRKGEILSIIGIFANPQVNPRGEDSNLIILGFESSCDETGVGVYSINQGLISHSLHSQIQLHENYGGVVPELASRDHLKRIINLTKAALSDAKITLDEINGIAYTRGPGLAGALLVGASVATSIAYTKGIPCAGVHHLEGHILSPFINTEKRDFPFLTLLVSGGHTQLIEVKAVGEYLLLGDTRDDAAGEAFDKTAKLLGLPYPGGSKLSDLAKNGNRQAYEFPRPMLDQDNLDFSFSGLKTAVANLVNKSSEERKTLSETNRADIAASFEDAITDVLVSKSLKALRTKGLKRLVVSGGVGANSALRKKLDRASKDEDFETLYPPIEFCTDNGAMIALLGAEKIKNGVLGPAPFDIKPRWPLTQ